VLFERTWLGVFIHSFISVWPLLGTLFPKGKQCRSLQPPRKIPNTQQMSAIIKPPLVPILPYTVRDMWDRKLSDSVKKGFERADSILSGKEEAQPLPSKRTP
jgi:hypothetical protein